LFNHFNDLSKRGHSFPATFPTRLGFMAPKITISTPCRPHIARHLGIGLASVCRALEGGTAPNHKRATGLKVEGRKNYAEINPDMVAMARKLQRYKVQRRKRMLREIASELEKAGFITGNSKPYAAAAVVKMIEA
jgi:hypothetical protein